MPKTKFSALLSLLLVFGSGILVGAVGYRLYMVNSVAMGGPPPGRPPQRDPEEVRKHRIQEMRDRVKLDDEQVARLNTIYDHTRQEFHALKKKGDEEGRVIWDRQRDAVRAILRQDQIPLYEQYQKELDEQHRRERERRQQEAKGTR
jgi:hypothetical protein